MKIAIIGTGIAGLGAAWLLNKNHDITVYEALPRLGGHSNTVQAPGTPPVDTGFIVYNEWTYPNLIALFDHLGVETEKSDMSFAVSLRQGQFEYAGDNLFVQRSNILNPGFYRMLFDIVRFYRNAPEILGSEQIEDLTLGAYLQNEKYSEAFVSRHILPMAGAIWSTGVESVGDFPLQAFVQFFVNHGLLKLKGRPQWHTVKGGSRQYVEKISALFRDKIKTDCPAISISRADDHVTIQDKSGETKDYDHVVLACHSDEALGLLSDRDAQETEILSAFPYTANTAYLHTDEALMPRRRGAWSSWNYLSDDPENRVSLTYWMNRLQPSIGNERDIFVTLNPVDQPADQHLLQKIEYTHPHYTLNALKAWPRIKNIQARRRTWFCGAWCGYGFHEDGLSAGLAVAEALGGADRPWNVQDKSPAGQHVRPD